MLTRFIQIHLLLLVVTLHAATARKAYGEDAAAVLRGADPSLAIDMFLHRHWNENAIKPAARCSSQLMPKCATILDKLAIVRSMKTKPSEHFQAIDMLTRGDAPRPPFVRPILGSVLGQQLGQLDRPVPNFILLDPCPEGNEFKAFKAGNWAGWLGAEYGPVRAGGPYRIPNIDRAEQLSEADHADREALRRFLSKKYENDRQSAAAATVNAAFDRVSGLMSCAPLFDLNRLPERDREKYGPGNFGMHTLLALDSTLVIAMGEFGRTPWLNEARGRDHYPNAWSLAMAGDGVKPGAVFGATDEDGVDVLRDPVDQRRLFATIFTALGLDPHQAYDLPGLPTFYRVEGEAEPIHEILA